MKSINDNEDPIPAIRDGDRYRLAAGVDTFGQCPFSTEMRFE
jgi:hypothetical protein